MKKFCSKKNCINIRKWGHFLCGLSVVLTLSILLSGNFTSTPKVHAAEISNNGDSTEYVLEIVTKGSVLTGEYDKFRAAIITLNYTLENGQSGTLQVPVSRDFFSASHPYVAPEDYDSRYDFTYNSDYVNPIAQNSSIKNVADSDLSIPSFPDNNKPYRASYDMQDRSFWTLPQNLKYNFTKMNEFAARKMNKAA